MPENSGTTHGCVEMYRNTYILFLCPFYLPSWTVNVNSFWILAGFFFYFFYFSRRWTNIWTSLILFFECFTWATCTTVKPEEDRWDDWYHFLVCLVQQHDDLINGFYLHLPCRFCSGLPAKCLRSWQISRGNSTKPCTQSEPFSTVTATPWAFWTWPRQKWFNWRLQ